MENVPSTNEYFDGNKYSNLFPPKIVKKNLWQFFKWRFQRQTPPWPKWVDLPPYAPLLPRVFDRQFSVSFINHATVLIQVAGLNILTDPIWSERCSPIKWLGPKRVHAPGIPFSELPPIDMVLVSHDHYDHLDLPTLAILQQEYQPNFFSGLAISSIIYKKMKSADTVDLQWWETIKIDANLSLTFVPAQHWSRRGIFHPNRTLWGGFILTTADHTIYFSGDTGFGPHVYEIAKKFPQITLAILPIGAYEPRWFMQHAHINPEEAVLIHKILNARFSLGVHFNTFSLGDESYNQPLVDLNQSLLKHGIGSEEFFTLLPGQVWQFIDL